MEDLASSSASQPMAMRKKISINMNKRKEKETDPGVMQPLNKKPSLICAMKTR